MMDKTDGHLYSMQREKSEAVNDESVNRNWTQYVYLLNYTLKGESEEQILLRCP